MSDTHEIETLQACHALFEGLTPEDGKTLLQAAKIQDLCRGDIVFKRHQRLDSLYILLSGQIKTSIPVQGGQEKVVEFIRAGDVFGETALTPSCVSEVQAQALTACRLLKLERSALQSVLGSMPALAMVLLSKMAQRIQEYIGAIESATFKSASQRVAEYVLKQPRSGDQMQLMYHKRSIASTLGLQPETFSRSLKYLAHEGLISVHGSRITIHDEVELRKLAVYSA